MNTENTKTLVLIYKGIEIFVVKNNYYIFFLNGIKYGNTNIHMAKRMITRNLK